MTPRDPDLHDDGTPREITKIEFEVLGSGRFRWILWSDHVRTTTECGNPRDLKAFLETTGILIGGIEYVEESQTEEERKREAQDIEAAARTIREFKASRSQADKVPRRLGGTDRR